jgi:amino-acid N-acetyltransferase
MISIVKLSQKDIGALNQLLEIANLPLVESNDSTENFFKAVNESGVIMGAIGLEKHGNSALLRSLVVNENYRGQGIAKLLVDQIINLSKNLNLKKLVLLTTTADKYFDKHHFERIQRNDVPEEIKHSREFSSICPVSAIVMQKAL